MKMTVAWSAEGVPWMWSSELTTGFIVGRFCSSLLKFYFLPTCFLCCVTVLPQSLWHIHRTTEASAPVIPVMCPSLVSSYVPILIPSKSTGHQSSNIGKLQAWYIGFSSHHCETHVTQEPERWQGCSGTLKAGRSEGPAILREKVLGPTLQPSVLVCLCI